MGSSPSIVPLPIDHVSERMDFVIVSIPGSDTPLQLAIDFIRIAPQLSVGNTAAPPNQPAKESNVLDDLVCVRTLNTFELIILVGIALGLCRAQCSR
jgi:hypothetical protein